MSNIPSDEVAARAAAIIGSMRAGKLPSGDAAIELDHLPIIDSLRTAVTTDDTSWLLAAVEGGDDRLAGLAISMLRGQINDSAVFGAFERRWESASVFLRIRLLWRMLDLRSLSPEWQDRLQTFAFSHWDEFSDFSRRFYGPGLEGVSQLMKRVVDPATSTSKRWAYVCNIPAVLPDPTAARALIYLTAGRYRELEGPFCDRVLSFVGTGQDRRRPMLDL